MFDALHFTTNSACVDTADIDRLHKTENAILYLFLQNN